MRFIRCHSKFNRAPFHVPESGSGSELQISSPRHHDRSLLLSRYWTPYSPSSIGFFKVQIAPRLHFSEFFNSCHIGVAFDHSRKDGCRFPLLLLKLETSITNLLPTREGQDDSGLVLKRRETGTRNRCLDFIGFLFCFVRCSPSHWSAHQLLSLGKMCLRLEFLYCTPAEDG